MAEHQPGSNGRLKGELLVEYAAAHGLDEAQITNLERLLWKSWAHPDLIGLSLFATSVREICWLSKRMWNQQLDAFGVEQADLLSVWLEEHLPSMVSTIGIDERKRQVAAGKNAVLWKGVGLNAIYAMLCDTHVSETHRVRYRLLQGHILVAFSLALESESSLEAYRRMCRVQRGRRESGTDKANAAEPLPQSCAEVGRAARRLSRDQPMWLALLEWLEVNRSPESFATWIEGAEFVPTIDDSHRAVADFRALRSFFVRIYADRRQSVAGEGGKAYGVPNRGQGEMGCWGSMVEWPSDESALPYGEEFHFYISPLGPDGATVGIDSDGDFEEMQEFSVTRPPNVQSIQTSSWKQNNRKMMANQLLPFNYEDLNGSELRDLWSYLWNWWKSYRIGERRKFSRRLSRDLEMGALLWVMLWTVSSIERAVSLIVCSPQDHPPDSPLAVLITGDEDAPESIQWRIQQLSPRAQYANIPSSRQVSDHILLPDTAGGSAWVLAFRRSKPIKNLKVFTRSAEEYRVLIQAFFKCLAGKGKITSRLTPDRYTKVLFWRLLHRSGHDFSSVSLITGEDHILNRSRLHYTTRRASDMQRLYIQCAEDLATEIAAACGLIFTRMETLLQADDVHLGARHCPTMTAVQTAVSTLRDRLSKQEYLRFPQSTEEHAEFVREHDQLTLYVYWMFAFATGVRGVVDPYPQLNQVDLRTGILALDDKESNSGIAGYKRRLVWLPPMLRQQMQSYEVYLRQLKRRYGITSNEPSFFLESEGGMVRCVPVRPSELRSRVVELLPFPANTQRLFLRSELLERGCSAEVVDAFMGHWSFGEEPWAPYSTFNYAYYFDRLDQYIAPLLEEIGFAVLRRRIVD